MCGRYARRSDKQRIAEAFRIGNLDELTLELSPSYNVAPTSMQPVVVSDRETGERQLRVMRWGLLPTWAKSPKDFALSTINAKAEDIETKQMWRRPFQRRRCLVPADAFYEWLKLDARTKQPYAYGLKDGSMLVFAGVWEHWKQPDGPLEMDTFSIITTEANELAAMVHKRMPVILQPKDYQRWLVRDDAARPPADLLRPYDADAMKAWKVDPSVGNVRNDEPGLLCIEWE